MNVFDDEPGPSSGFNNDEDDKDGGGGGDGLFTPMQMLSVA